MTPDQDVTLGELGRRLDRIDTKLDGLPSRDEVKAQWHRITALEDAQKWISRTSVAALLAAVLPRLMELAGGH